MASSGACEFQLECYRECGGRGVHRYLVIHESMLGLVAGLQFFIACDLHKEALPAALVAAGFHIEEGPL